MTRKLVGVKLVEPFDLYDISVENDHCFELSNGVIAHNSMYPSDVIAGGTGGIYSSNLILKITKQQVKEGSELAGWQFTIHTEKSRYVKEKSKFPFTVLYEGGIGKYSGLMEIAVDAGFVDNSSKGWYSKIDTETGEVSGKYRLKDTNNKDFWDDILENEKFRQYVRDTYQLGSLEVEDID